jgi:hypothetical protein
MMQVNGLQRALRPGAQYFRAMRCFTLSRCLKCHGSPGMELDSAAHALITERYPCDAAVGYALGEFRGYWSVRWPRTRVPR